MWHIECCSDFRTFSQYHTIPGRISEHFAGKVDTLINYNVYWLLQKNVKEMMDVNGIKVLVDLLTLAHLHTTRAVVPFQVMCRFE